MRKFRESKYLNESGSKRGTWYVNRLDYFQFHEYPEFKKHRAMAIVIFILCLFVIIELLPVSFFIALPFMYVAYVSLRTFDVLRNRVCRYRGYFLYPRSFVSFFEARKVDIDVNDFDSVATMNDK